MTLILGFLPFMLFTLLSRISADLALWTAFAAAFVVTIRDFVESPQLRLLDGVSFKLFGLLALWRGFWDPGLSLDDLRLIVDLGLTGAILFSLVRRRPFSLQYAGRDGWAESDFLRVNYIISLVWLIAFTAMALADALNGIVMPALDFGVGISVVALTVAIAFTLRYPASVQR
jgi:hypothetical protein